MRRAFSIPLAIVAAISGLCSPPAAAAQDASDSAAYRALTQTPAGALPATMDVSMSGVRDRAPVFQVRYGIMSYDNHEYVHNFGVGVSLPVGSASIGLTGGYYWPNCNGQCEGHAMFGASLSQNLATVPLGGETGGAGGGSGGGGGGAFNIGLRGKAGYARQGATLVSGELALPVSLVPASRSLRLVPYIAPGLGFGMVRDGDGTEAGLLFTFGAGLGLLTSHGFTATAGISRAFLSTGNWLAGVGITVGPGR